MSWQRIKKNVLEKFIKNKITILNTNIILSLIDCGLQKHITEFHLNQIHYLPDQLRIFRNAARRGDIDLISKCYQNFYFTKENFQYVFNHMIRKNKKLTFELLLFFTDNLSFKIDDNQSKIILKKMKKENLINFIKIENVEKVKFLLTKKYSKTILLEAFKENSNDEIFILFSKKPHIIPDLLNFCLEKNKVDWVKYLILNRSIPKNMIKKLYLEEEYLYILCEKYNFSFNELTYWISNNVIQKNLKRQFLIILNKSKIKISIISFLFPKYINFYFWLVDHHVNKKLQHSFLDDGLIFAAKTGSYDACIEILKRGACTNHKQGAALSFASQNGHERVVNLLKVILSASVYV